MKIAIINYPMHRLLVGHPEGALSALEGPQPQEVSTMSPPIWRWPPDR
jgi:hypothetical protein